MAAPCVSARGLSCLPRELQQKLLPFQRDGIKFALSRKGRCLIGDEMGLGKTLQAISVAYCYQSEWPLLIVVPTALRYPWIEELEKWLPVLQPNDFNLIASGTDIRVPYYRDPWIGISKLLGDIPIEQIKRETRSKISFTRFLGVLTHIKPKSSK